MVDGMTSATQTHRAPHDLRLDHGADPLGITVEKPSLSWKLPATASTQVAYQLRIGEWDSGRVESREHVYVPYGGPSLESRVRYEWSVKVWTDLGETPWSTPSWFETGLLDPDEWKAEMISPSDTERPDAGHRPAYRMRGDFDCPQKPTRALVRATAHGIYELFLNGERVGDHELTPGFTEYRKHLEVQTFDITDLLANGSNEVEANLSDGWYCGQHGFTRAHDGFGQRLALLVQFEFTDADGSIRVFGTDGSWEWGFGSITKADLIEGQDVDQRRDVDKWTSVEVVAADRHRLTSSPAGPVRTIERIRPVSIRQVGAGHHVVDLGENINGWVRLEKLGPAGTTITLTHGEQLDERGDVDLSHHFGMNPATGEVTGPGQVDTVTSAGRSQAFEPRHATKGFQFVRVEGLDDKLTDADIHGMFVHTDMERTGWFSCSDDRINALHDAATRSFRGNACAVPTDCPTRERSGWTGDWMIFAPTAAELYDVAGFSARWLRDLSSSQWPDGRLPNWIPDPGGPDHITNPLADMLTGSSGWGDASVIVPWDMYQAYGDRRFLTDHYDTMAAWLGYAADRARNHRHPDRAASRPTPAEYEQFLWDTGFHWGEWLEPGQTPADMDPTADQSIVATAYLHRSATLLAKIASIIGRDDVNRWNELAAGAAAAWRGEFVNRDGSLTIESQANLVRGLEFGLIPDPHRHTAAARLDELVHNNGNHLATGFLATPYLLPVLADHGYLDTAYQLLFQDTSPSWLGMIDAGANTIWEFWDGTATGFGSLNHYSKGAVISFLHRYVAGVRQLESFPGFERFRVQPQPGGGITHASGSLDTMRGRIESSWSVHEGRIDLDVVVPAGSSAEVVLPDGQVTEVPPGEHHVAGGVNAPESR